MMQNTMDCGFGGWVMMGAGVLLLVLLGLGTAALIKYLFFTGRAGKGRVSHNG